jgi:hypothetical protein
MLESWLRVEPAPDRSAPSAPNLVVFSGLPGDTFWTEGLNLGGWDALAKPSVPEEVAWSARNAWFNWRSR